MADPAEKGVDGAMLVQGRALLGMPFAAPESLKLFDLCLSEPLPYP